jgi:hypothetical protein
MVIDKVADVFVGERIFFIIIFPVQDSRQQATKGQSQSVRLPEPRLKIAPYQCSILVGYVGKIRRVG